MFSSLKEVNPDIKRWCKHCHVSNKDVKFFSGILKNKYGRKRFYFNICMPCKTEQRRKSQRIYYKSHRRENIEAATKWNKAHRPRIRALSKLRRKKLRLGRITVQPAFAF